MFSTAHPEKALNEDIKRELHQDTQCPEEDQFGPQLLLNSITEFGIAQQFK
jgi:hypothetical protein